MSKASRATSGISGLILCVSGVTIASLTACNKLAEKLIEKTEKAINAETVVAAAKAVEPAKDPEVERDDNLADKLAHYIECLNSTSRGVLGSRDRYLSWASKDGVTGKERNIYGLYKLSDPKYCFKDLAEAKAKPPALPEIEQAAERYEAAFKALDAQVQPAYAYYDQNDYKDDKFAKGKAMHAPLLAAFADFENANDTFDKLVVTLNEEVGARELVRVSKDPSRQLEFRGRKLVNVAKEIVKMSSVETLAALDATLFGAKVDALSEAITDLETYVSSHAAEAEKAQNEERLLSESKELQKAAKELLRRKRENKDFNKEFFSRNNPQMVEGHPAQVIEKFNSFIRTSNSTRY